MPFDVILLEPAIEFIGGLDAKLKAKTMRTIELLQHLGPMLPMPHSRKLVGHDLFELRVRQSNNICRLFYFHHEKRIYVVTSGYVKKSQKTSIGEIEKALRIKNEFERGDKE